MGKVIDKLTSYNLFNYLLPGVLFSVALEHLTPYSLTHENLIIAAFVYYFVGLIVSRFGSLVIEPILKWIHFLKFASYPDFVAATKEDPKIEELSETNNMYRTFISAMVVLAAAKGYELLSYKIPFLAEHSVLIGFVALFVMLSFAYRKQTQYITKRINPNKS
ncbi:MAG: hypothetical protein WCW36_03680 [Candidatus Paceibacterota bacterium]|jgi:hypothetical protein